MFLSLAASTAGREYMRSWIRKRLENCPTQLNLRTNSDALKTFLFYFRSAKLKRATSSCERSRPLDSSFAVAVRHPLARCRRGGVAGLREQSHTHRYIQHVEARWLLKEEPTESQHYLFEEATKCISQVRPPLIHY